MKQIAKVNSKALAAATLFQARNDVRYYLNGVLITPDPKGGVNVVATDGHRMCVVTDREGYTDKPIILDIEPASVTKMKQACFTDVQIVKHTEQEIFCKMESPTRPNRHIGYVKIIDGKFPDWTQVIKDELPKESVQMAAVNSVYVRDFCEANKIISEKRINSISVVNGSTNHEPICIVTSKTSNPNLHLRGVIMPLKYSEEDLSWLPKERK